jgi:hypothetical protein
MEDRTINLAESLDIIQSMVRRAQQRYSDDSFYYIMWGWLVFAAAITHFVLIRLGVANSSVVWLAMPLGGIVSAVYGMRQSKREKVKTYVNTYMGYVWIALGVSMIVVLSMMFKMGIENVYPVLILLYGIGTFVSGGLLAFRPLIIGGVVCFGLAIGAFFVAFEYQLLLIAVAMLTSYIIPGHLLRAQFKR